MLDQLNGCRLVRRIEADSDLDYVLLFENAAGRSRLVAWTAPPPGGAPGEARPHEVAVSLVTATPGADLSGATREVEVSTGAIHLALSGAPQYVTVPEGARLGRCRVQGAASLPAARPAAVPSSGTTPAAAAAPGGGAAPAAGPAGTEAAVPDALPADGVDLKLFAAGTAWNFVKNTGEGSFTLGTDSDGRPIGTMAYDFTASKSRTTPYVLASAPLTVPEGATAVLLQARSAIAQPLTFRVTDSTEQTHQVKLRLRGAYGRNLVAGGPLFARADFTDGKAVCRFTETGSGLVLKAGAPNGFEIAGSDHVFRTADAVIAGDTAVVSNPAVPAPAAVRYGWTNAMPRVTLFNLEGLPASPFRSDDW
jgi:hypothetical protein